MNPYLPVIALFLLSRIVSYTDLTVATEPELYYEYARQVRDTSIDELYHGQISRPYPFKDERQTQPPEYPQLTALFLTPPLWLAESCPEISRFIKHRPRSHPPTIAAYEAALGLQLFAVDAVLLGLLFLAARQLYPEDSRRLRAIRLGIYVAASAVLAPVWFDRLDTVVGVFVVSAILASARGRPRLAYGFLVLGSCFKLVPLFLLPLWVMAAACQRSRTKRGFLGHLFREAAIAGVILLSGLLLLYLLGGGDRAFVFLTPHAVRGIQPESSYGPIVAWLDTSTKVVFNYGGFHLVGSLAARMVPITTIVLLALVALSYLIAAKSLLHSSDLRAPHPSFLPRAAMLTLLLFILGGKVASPHYVIWLMPLAALLPLRTPGEQRAAMWFLALCGIMTLLFPLISGQVTGPRIAADLWDGSTTFGLVFVTARTAILVGLAFWQARSLWGSASEAPVVER